jgi:hypothetical protein
MNNKKTLNIWITRTICIFTLLSMGIVYGWAADDDQSQETISGKVDQIDWIDSTIAVRYSDPLSGVSDELVIVVPKDTKIMNGSEPKELSDIDQGDPVTVIYYDAGLSGLKARSIMDLNEGNR